MTAPERYSGFDEMPIGGRRRPGGSGESRAVTDPWSGETLVEIVQADRSDLDEAFARAAEAQVAWAARLPMERAEILHRAGHLLEAREDEVLDWLAREAGGTRPKAEIELRSTLADFREGASLPHRVQGRILPADVAGKESRVYRRPLGVVAVISPWNFPLHLSARSVVPALALGNAVVLKPAGDTPVTGGLLLARVLEEAGLPEGLLSVVVGPGSEIGDAIVEHPTARLVSFTGSTPVGEGITKKAGVKRLALELGGNGPLVVLDDADLDRAVDAAVFGSFLHQGQICIAANRVIVDESVKDAFVARFRARVETLPVGDPSDPATVIGPIINRSQLESIQDKVRRAVEDGAVLLHGGDPRGPAGLSLPPHLLLGTNETATAAEEVFGPVQTVIGARDEEHALELANDVEHGLSSAGFTRDVERGVRFALRIEAGMTHVNDHPVNDEANTAFGGEKASGLGRFGGDWAIDEFTTDHWVSIQHEPRELPF